MIDDLATWKSTFAALSKHETSAWTTDFSDWVAARVVNMELTDITNSGPQWTFSKSAFKSGLDAMVPTPAAPVGAANLAAAWQMSVLASSLLTLLPGAYLGSATPATTWSAISTQLIDPPSILLGFAKVLTIATKPNVPDVADAPLPEVLRDAFLLLTGTINGMNSIPIPVSLIAPLVPFS